MKILQAGYMKNMSDWNRNLKQLLCEYFELKNFNHNKSSLKSYMHVYMVKLLK